MSDWLKTGHITTIAMESTGVYWLPAFEILEAAGFNVILVNGLRLGNGKYCTIRASPACQRRCLRFLSALQLEIKGRDCGTINGHDESSSIRALMKDAREALVR